MLTRTLTPREIWHALRQAGTRLYEPDQHSPKHRSCRYQDASEILANAPGLGKKRCGEIAEKVAKRNRVLDRYTPARESWTLHKRLLFHVQTKIEAEASRRWLPVRLDLKREGTRILQRVGYHFDTKNKAHIMLLHAEGWAEYSRREPRRYRALSLLGGVGPEGLWAVRVPGIITDIADALDWIEPAAVKEARRRGSLILRQGDVYLVARKRGQEDASELPANHRWNPETRMLNHPEHPPLHIPFKWRAYVQRTLPANGIGRVDGD